MAFPLLGILQMLRNELWVGPSTTRYKRPATRTTQVFRQHPKPLRHANTDNENRQSSVLQTLLDTELFQQKWHYARDKHTERQPPKRFRRNIHPIHSRKGKISAGDRKTPGRTLELRHSRSSQNHQPASLLCKPRQQITIRNGVRSQSTRIPTSRLRIHRLGPHRSQGALWKNVPNRQTVYLYRTRPQRIYPMGSTTNQRHRRQRKIRHHTRTTRKLRPKLHVDSKLLQ